MLIMTLVFLKYANLINCNQKTNQKKNQKLIVITKVCHKKKRISGLKFSEFFTNTKINLHRNENFSVPLIP